MPVTQGYQQCAGIGHGGEAGFREEAHRGAVLEQVEELLHFRGGRVLIELVELQLPDVPLEAGGGQEPPRRAGLLHHKTVQGGEQGKNGCGKHGFRRSVSQRGGNKV